MSRERRGVVELIQDAFHMEEYLAPGGHLRRPFEFDRNTLPRPLRKSVQEEMSEQSDSGGKSRVVSYDRAREMVFDLLPEYEEYIEELIRLDRENPAEDHGFLKYSPRPVGWTTDDAYLPPAAYTTLLNAGIITKFKETNSSKYYTSRVDADTMEELLEEYQEIEESEAAQGQAEPVSTDVVESYTRPEELPPDIFDTIIGYEEAKRIFERAITSEGQTHIALRGEAGVAKSAFLREIEELDAAHYRTANGMTRAGLTSFVMDTRPLFLLLDELEKTKGGDADPTNVLYNLMEEGIVQTTQSSKGAGEGAQEVEVPCDVYATVNDWRKLADPIQDRFIDLTFERYDREEYIEVVVGVLQKFHDADEGVALKIATEVLDTLGERSVRTAEQVYELARGPDDVRATVQDIQTYR